MNQKDFKKLKSQLDKILSKIEDAALEKGMVITSQEFQTLLTELKRKLLAERGIALEDYEIAELETETRVGIEEDDVIQLGERTKAFSTARKKEFKEKTDQIVSEFNKELQGKYYSLKAELDDTKKSALTTSDVLNIVRPLIPKIPEHGDFNHPKILEALKTLNDKISEIIAGDKTGELKKDLFKIQEDFTGLYDKVKNIKIPKDYVATSVLEPSIKEIIAPELNRIIRSLQSQIYRVDVAVKERVIRSGFYKLTVSATEPTNPSVNDLWVDIG